ncbi:HTH-type transcriptional regulator VirS [compost metagenome]
MHARVRGLVRQLLGGDNCTNEFVASELCLHPRTLQRRLRLESASFESIKDDVRKEVASHYLRSTDLPLSRVAEKLGYAEASVLSRSCYRWFGAAPLQVRRQSAEVSCDARAEA